MTELTNQHFPYIKKEREKIDLFKLEEFKNFKKRCSDYRITEDYANTVVSLPLYNGMTKEEIDYVIEKINEYKQVKMIEGKIINLRLVKEEDGNFILKLRNNKELSKYISPTNINLEEQKEWIRNYKVRENKKEEFYFIVENKNKIPCGTVRIYNIDHIKKECTWGSFILDKTRPKGASTEVIEISLNFILEKLKLEKVYLDVRKENYKAIYIYEKNGFLKIKESLEDYIYLKRLR